MIKRFIGREKNAQLTWSKVIWNNKEAVLKKAGFDVQGIDATGEHLENIQRIPNKSLQYNGLEIDALIDKVDVDSKVIGISSMFTHEWTYIRDCITKLKNSSFDNFTFSGQLHNFVPVAAHP